MTLSTIIGRLTDIALRMPNVSSVIINDIYRENAFSGIDYAAIGILQDDHVVGDNTITYGITLVYVDRLLPDGSNEVDIQSSGMLTLTHLLNTLQNEDEDVTIDDEVTYTSYNQRFTDDCAGVYAKVNITVEAVLGACSAPIERYDTYITTDEGVYTTSEGDYYLIKK